MSRLLREPLLHFAVLGALIFGLDALFGPRPGQDLPRVEISAAEINHLRTLWQRTWQRPPTPAELRGAVDARVREEILYRQALAMGLDKDDTVVRRRLVQKLEFLTEDLASDTQPGEQELDRYRAANADRYSEPARLGFSQIYFNPDRRGTPQAEAAARDALLVLNAGPGSPPQAGEALGDPLLGLEFTYADVEMPEVARLFGQEFAHAIAPLAPGSWQGPVRSGYGVHLVYVSARTPGRVLPLAEVGDAVRRDFLRDRRVQHMEALYERLKAGYRIVIDEAALAGAPGKPG